MGRSVYYTYDTSGRLWTVKDVNGGTTTFAYDISNNMTSIVDPRQLTYVTNYYDANNRVYKQVLADGSMYQFSYVNAGGNPTCVGVCPISGSNIIETDVTNPRQYVRKATFNSDGYTSADTSAVGRPEQQTLTFNREPGSGLLLSVTDMLNRQTTEAYDAKGLRSRAILVLLQSFLVMILSSATLLALRILWATPFSCPMIFRAMSRR